MPLLSLKRTQNPCFFSVSKSAGDLHQFEQPVSVAVLASKTHVERGKAKTNVGYENPHLISIVQAASIS